MSLAPFCIFRRGNSPIVAAAVHHGHGTRPQIARALALKELARLREEDPFTGEWAQIAKTQIIGMRSRFEVDFNRPREAAIYRTPEDAWGLEVWRAPPPSELLEASLREYDLFYKTIEDLLRQVVAQHGHGVVYDLHTYNHRRAGPEGPPADPLENPEVNVGTGSMDRKYWGAIVDRFMHDLQAFDFNGRQLDVRENVKFQGGGFGKWIHATFPKQVCVLSIEFKKFFMNEWTGEADLEEVERIYNALQSTLSGVAEELERL